MIVYYMGGLMINIEESRISLTRLIWMSIGLMIFGWLIYDLVLGKLFKNEIVGATLSFVLITVLSWFLVRYFSGRAAFLQLGAMFGTIMFLNVWMRILPAQRRMVAALKEGKAPDAAEAKRRKSASKQNTFIAIPVVFIMVSNHFPMVYRSSSQLDYFVRARSGGLVCSKINSWGLSLLLRAALNQFLLTRV